MRYDRELAELARLLRMGAKTARTIAAARGRDGPAITDLADEADAMALDLDAIVGAEDPRAEGQAAVFRLRRDR